MADNFFNAVDNENKYDILKSQQNASPKRSVFPYGRSKSLVMNEGYIIPLDYIPIIPGDSVDLTLLANVQTLNPFVDKMFSGMRLVIHAFFQKFEHEWEGWKNFATQGRRGNIALKLPEYNVANNNLLCFNGYPVTFDVLGNKNPVPIDFDKVGSLSNYLCDYAHITGINGSSKYATLYLNNQMVVPVALGLGPNSQYCRSFKSSVFDSDASSNPLYKNIWTFAGQSTSQFYVFNAIPFSMYQRIFRDFYLNKNAVKDNPLWFPDNEDDFVLPYSNSLPIYAVGREWQRYTQKSYQIAPNNHKTVATASVPSNGVQISDYSLSTQYADAPSLGALRCRQWNGDPFTTGTPFLERGGVTEQFLAAFNAVISNSQIPDGALVKNVPVDNTSASGFNVTSHQPTQVTARVNLVGVNGQGQTGFTIGVFQTMNKLRELSVMTLWSEKNARCDGDYNSLIRAHYGVDPNSQDRSARYLGGTILRLNFDNVYQQSASGNTPLGSRVSIASASGSGRIGYFEFKDFGAIMILGSLIPDTFYTQGIDNWFNPNQTGVDLPFPEFTSLPRGVITSGQVFAQGNSADNNLFVYQERFLDYKYRMSRLSGPLVDYTDLKWRSMSFARYFDVIPVFNNEFLTMTPYSLRNDMYTAPYVHHWIVQFADNIRLVRSLPYMNKEANLVI